MVSRRRSVALIFPGMGPCLAIGAECRRGARAAWYAEIAALLGRLGSSGGCELHPLALTSEAFVLAKRAVLRAFLSIKLPRWRVMPQRKIGPLMLPRRRRRYQ